MPITLFGQKKNRRRLDRIISHSFWWQIGLLAITVTLLFIVLCTASFILYPVSDGEIRIWNMLSHFIEPGSFGVYNGENDETGHLWIVITNLLGMIFLGGALIAILSNMLERHVDKIKNGKIYYKFTGHIVIFGFDKMLIGLTKQIAKEHPNSNIVIQTVQEAAFVRCELFAHVNEDIEKKITIVNGYRNSMEDMKKLRIEKCKELFLLGESGEYDHDTLNVDCLQKIKTILKSKKTEKRCHVLFEHQSTFAVFQWQDLYEIKEWIDFVPFNFYETWAQKIFVACEYKNADNIIDYPKLDRTGIGAESPETVHLVIIGMSRMGIALGVQASHLCHFPNFIKDKTKKTRITFIDENADRKIIFLKDRYRHLFKEITHSFEDMENPENNKICSQENLFTDIEWHFIKGRIENPAVHSKIEDWCSEKNVFLTIAVCFSYPPAAIATGLYLPDTAYDINKDISVLIRQETSYSTLKMLANSPKFKNLKAFGMLDSAYDLNKANDLLPMMIKYAYDKTQNEPIRSFPKDIIKENWKKNWQPEDNISALKWSNCYCANSIFVKQRAVNINIGEELNSENINLLARVEHNRWNIEKLLMGFRAATPEESNEIKVDKAKKKFYRKNLIHEDIRHYDELTEDYTGRNVREYDEYIIRAIPFMLEAYEK